MARKNFILDTLLEKGEVIWNPKGNSMTGKIESGDQVFIKKIPNFIYQVGDIVYVKIKSNYYLHLISAIDESQNRYQISNNHGYINGWVSENNIYGLCIRVNDRILISDEELNKRIK